LTKEQHVGRLAQEWTKESKEAKFESIDISTAMSAAMAVKDDDELVSAHPIPIIRLVYNLPTFVPKKSIRTAAHLSSTLLTHHLAPRLEILLDRQTKITHSQLGQQVESRLGSGEGEEAKGPDMKVFSKNKHLSEVHVNRGHLLFLVKEN
jgi:nucleosome binding factor SPN SPT16 subunit